LPVKNRYVNLNKIKTTTFEKVDKLTKKQIITLIRLNYFRNKENRYEPKEENIMPYFLGHNDSSFLSYFIEPELLMDNKTGKTIEENMIVGAITSRPLHVIIHSKYNNPAFDIYYVDYLCVNKNWRKKNIAPQLIQTHEYIQSHNNRKISVSLFKREDELTGIIPLTVYKTFCFSMKKWNLPTKLNGKMTILTGDKQNMYYLYNFIKEIGNNWDILIYPEITNLIELVSSNNLFIKMLVIDGNIEAVYIFRKTCVYIEKDDEIVSCIASVMKKDILTTNEFINGFKFALSSIKVNNNFKYVSIEDISDNGIIINNICIKTYPMLISPMAYFFYNFAYTPFKSNKCLIIT
jgi:hypothetical protein